MADSYSVDDVICACIAGRITDGQILAQGLATPLVAAGYLLAWHTHAPNSYFASAIGQTICREGAPLGLSSVEALWLDKAMYSFGFIRAVADLLPAIKPVEYFRPGQVDSRGNSNNVAIGDDPANPRLRLPGAGGIPDVTTYLPEPHLYVPRHSRVTFVDRVDIRSGLGHESSRIHGSGPVYLVSDLGQFDFESGRMRLTHLHPGVSVDRVRMRTGFELPIREPLETSSVPTDDQLRLLNEVIDPLGVRRLERLGGAARKEELRRILEAEQPKRT